MRAVLQAGAPPERLSFGNTIKKEADVADAHRLGVRLFAFDAEAELEKIARAAPGARVFCRILIDTVGADWLLSRKFGCAPAMAVDLLRRAPSLGLRPWGISFHVGSQQTDPDQWDPAIFASLRTHFGPYLPGIVVEASRGLVGDAGVIETEVVLVAGKGGARTTPGCTWTSGSSGGSPRPRTR